MADILAAYRLPPDEGEKAALPRRVLGLTIAAFAGVLLVAGFLSYFHRAERAARAQRDFQQANTLAGAGRYEEAIEKYRSAVSISHSGQHRLALALALASAGRLSEAEIYLGEFLKENPTSGPANLGLARIKAQQDDIPRAVMDYHRAIYGAWAQNPAGNRAQTRLELIGFLGKSGLKQQAQAELLTLRSELPADPAMRKRAAHLFLDFGLPKEAAEVFREVLKSNESDAEARGGLGEAELALDDFDAARKAFADAARRDPANKAYQDGLRLAEAVIAMDPARRGLPPAERYARSRKLVEATLGSLDQCLARQAGSPPDADRSLAETARKALLSRRAPHSYGDAAAANVDLAGQVWGVRLRLCGPPNPTDEPVRKAMEQVQR